ncbi:MAG: RDD family protein [Desulfobacterales bacterium]|nr:RDD family protein [Desulfobacterales bacterium]
MTTYQFAGFWRRFVAYMIDGFIIGIIFILLMMVAGFAYLAGAMSGHGGAILAKITDPEQMASLTLWMWAFSIFINIAYFTYFHGSTGRTPGKTLLGLQVVSADGTSISYGIAFLRSVGYLVSSLVFCLGYIWVAFDKQKQGWHDKIAGTVVIIREPQGSDRRNFHPRCCLWTEKSGRVWMHPCRPFRGGSDKAGNTVWRGCNGGGRPKNTLTKEIRFYRGFQPFEG